MRSIHGKKRLGELAKINKPAKNIPTNINKANIKEKDVIFLSKPKKFLFRSVSFKKSIELTLEETKA
jgi:hypothetical protein